jgi:CDGSH-type Zn-finger protein/uncharacterized Fe-S cluster protein YjdI
MIEETRRMLAVHREQLVHGLYEAAELEHNLMCTYLYAAYSLKDRDDPGVTPRQADALARWKRTILEIAIEEMVHLAQVWNITAALGAAPRFGRGNFPLDPGYLPANVVVKLAPFNAATLQHFVYLERPLDSTEPDGDGFTAPRRFARGHWAALLTPMALDYDTVGEFYVTLSEGLATLCARLGDSEVFRGDPARQLSGAAVGLPTVRPVQCLKTARAALEAIVAQGEGAREADAHSHYQRFVAIRTELAALLADDPSFVPSMPAATNPVLRRPPSPEGRVWIEDADAIATVDLANASYGLMLRLLAYAYAVPAGERAKADAATLAVGLMRAFGPLAEHAARLPAGPSNPHCHAGVSFTTLRDAAAFPVGAAAEGFFRERFDELATAAAERAAVSGVPRVRAAAEQLGRLRTQAERAWPAAATRATSTTTATAVAAARATEMPAAPAATSSAVEVVDGREITIEFRAERCIHARFCVTGAPKVFLANVKGPWIHPDAMPTERLVEIAHACPSGAIHYRRHDGQPDESAPPVNLASVREGGPYAVRGALTVAGEDVGFRATLCRCGASRRKPYCDGSHHEAGFAATGEPATQSAEMLDVRDGPLDVTPETDGPLAVNGPLEIVSGTGRVVARVTTARLCRCGGSGTKPFCDGTHARIGFRS